MSVIKELIGHYVNYRKQISGKKLLPEKRFQLYAVTTRLPKKLYCTLLRSLNKISLHPTFIEVLLKSKI